MSEKVRVHEIAKELGISSKDVLEKAKMINLEVKSAQSVVTMEQAEDLANYIMNGEIVASVPKTEKKASKKVKSDTPKKDNAPKKDETKKATQKAKESVKPKKSSKPKTEKKVDVKTQTKEIEEKVEDKKTTGPVIVSNIKRSGLKIVKKKKPKVEESYSAPQKQVNISSYGKVSAEVLEELAKKKKSKQTTTAKKQDQGKKIDIFGGSMAEVSMDMDDQVVLLDLNETQRAPIIAEEPKKPRQPKPIGRNANKKQAPRGRKVRKDKKKK